MWPISRARYAPLTGTTTSPSRSAATCATTSSPDVAALITIRSPAREAGARAQRPATRRERSSSSALVSQAPLVVDRGPVRVPPPSAPPTPRAGCAGPGGRPTPASTPAGRWRAHAGSVRRRSRRGGYRGRPEHARRLADGGRARPGARGHGAVLGPPARRDAARRPPADRGRAHRQAHRRAGRLGAVLLLLALCSDGALGAWPWIGRRLHRVLDLVAAGVLAAEPAPAVARRRARRS